MKSIYQAYTRDINRQTHYFVKKYHSFPEIENFPPILDTMGMHRDFLKACELANVEDENSVQYLMEELNLTKVSGKVIPIQNVQREKREKASSIFNLPQQWLARLKWAHI